jgi:methylated-DNA-[protein]-cysteine S-methyltransferase
LKRKGRKMMQSIQYYASPLGRILLAGDEQGLSGLWFEGARHYGESLKQAPEEKSTPVLKAAEKWLDVYFAGHDPGPFQPLHICGTDFQKAVWEILLAIPYGKTCTYGEIARRIAAEKGLPHLSAQAVGGAVGRNRISIIIPCHRVVGTNGSLTGYAGGVDKKAALLRLEHAWTDGMHMPEE